jgi:hypothetical protein
MAERNGIETDELQRKPFFYFVSRRDGRLALIVRGIAIDSEKVMSRSSVYSRCSTVCNYYTRIQLMTVFVLYDRYLLVCGIVHVVF